MKNRISVYQICLVGLAIVLNIAGGQIALMLRLPVYLDSVGTILTGALLGPWFGMLPGVLGGIIMGITADIYSLYFAPVGMIIGFLTGLVFHGKSEKKGPLFLSALLISLPGTVVSSVICAVLFGGVTSSGSAILVQLLAKTPLGLTASIIAVQAATDYLDRVISLFLAAALIHVLPSDIKHRLCSKKLQHTC